MKLPTQTDLFDAVDATWAPYAFHNVEGWLIREGADGGQRVSAATLLPETQNVKIGPAAAKMVSLDQTPLFMIRDADATLDTELQTLEYKIVDPVVILVAQTDKLLRNPPIATQNIQLLAVPNKDAKSVWTAGGINQGRLNVMARVKTPKAILSAGNMGVAFAAAYKGIAMVHAVEVASDHRRKGIANTIMYAACQWAKNQNCNWVAVLTVRANTPARALYENLGMVEAAAYHYRRKALAKGAIPTKHPYLCS